MERKKDVAIFSISDSLGGAEQILLKIAEFYSRRLPVSLTIYFFQSQSSDYWGKRLGSKVEIVYLNYNFLFLFRSLLKKKFSIVYSSHLMINAILGVSRGIGLLKTERLVVRESTQVFGRYLGMKLRQYKLAYWLGYRNIDLIICQSERMLNALQEFVPYLFYRTKIEVIPNPFEFPSDSISEENIDMPYNSIVSAGRLIPEKGFDILIKVFSRVLRENPKLNLVILGDGGERSNLENLIESLDIKCHVFLTGFINNVYPYFKKAKLCVVASRMEGFPNTLLQMMSQNTKVVSTLCAGGIDELKGVETCLVEDEDALYEAICKVIDADTSGNRSTFDKELFTRSVENFLERIEDIVSKN